MSDNPCGSDTDRAIGTGLGGRVRTGVGSGWVLDPSLSGLESRVSRVENAKGGMGNRILGNGVEVDEVDLWMIGNWREWAVDGVGG